MDKAELLYTQKDNIHNLLNYMNIILLEQQILEPINTVEKTKKKLLMNNNYEMCIDNLLIKLWNDMHNINY